MCVCVGGGGSQVLCIITQFANILSVSLESHNKNISGRVQFGG